MNPEIQLNVEQLEERIAPSNPPGQLGYEGQPGNQGNGLNGYVFFMTSSQQSELKPTADYSAASETA